MGYRRSGNHTLSADKSQLADFMRKKLVVFLQHYTAGEEFHPALKQMYLIVI
jgi:hypothetical protein